MRFAINSLSQVFSSILECRSVLVMWPSFCHHSDEPITLQLAGIPELSRAVQFYYSSASFVSKQEELWRQMPPSARLSLQAKAVLGPSESVPDQAASVLLETPKPITLGMFAELQLQDQTLRMSYSDWRRLTDYYGSSFALQLGSTSAPSDGSDTACQRFSTLRVCLFLMRDSIEVLRAAGVMHFRYGLARGMSDSTYSNASTNSMVAASAV